MVAAGAPPPPVAAMAVGEPAASAAGEPDANRWPRPEPAAAAQAPTQPVAEPPLPSVADEAYSSFDYQPPFRPRRNRLKMWTMATSLFAVIAVLTLAAVARFGLPDWMPMPHATFGQAQPDLVLDFPPNRQDRRTLPNGTEFFGASGTVTNVGQMRRSVPTILIVLRDARERIVYSYEVAPPKRVLAPGESVTVNEAVTDVPKSARIAEIGWKPG